MQIFNEGRGTGWQHIYFTVEYETTRDETKLGIRWKIKWQIDTNYVFGYNIVATVWTEGTNYGRQIKANSPNKGGGEALFPADGGYYWFDKGYASNEIEGCRVIINSTNGGTINLDSGTDKTLTTPTGYKASTISNSIDFIVGNNIPIQIYDVTNQSYSYQLNLKVLDDNNDWTSIKTYSTTSKNFTLNLSNETNTIYSKITKRNSTKIKIELQTSINNISLGYTSKEGVCYITNSNPTALGFTITDVSGTEITSITTGFGPYNDQSNLWVKINKLASDNGTNSAKLKTVIIKVGNATKTLDISNYIGSGTRSEEFINAFSTMKDNEFIDGKAYVTVTVVDSRGNSAITQKQMAVSRYIPAYFTELQLKRTNNIDEEVKLIGKGKTQVLSLLIENNKPTITYYCEWDTSFINETIDKSYITFNEETNEFTVNAPLKGDLGALGFTKDEEFTVQVKIGDYVSKNYPTTYIEHIRKGKVLMHYGKNGIAFGDLYNESKGGPLQVNGKLVLDEDNCVAVYDGGNLDPNTTLHELILTRHNNGPERRWRRILLYSNYVL